jgi:hypothetical protein
MISLYSKYIMQNTVILLSLFFIDCYSLPPIPRKYGITHVSSNTMLPFTNLEGIITTRAFISSLIRNLSGEITWDKLIVQISYPHSDSILCISISLLFLYAQWKYLKDSQSMTKLQKIDAFIHREALLKNIIFIILYVFTKDVSSVT